MLDILKFILQDFWHWLGLIVLIIVVGNWITGFISILILSIRKRQL